MPLTDAQSDALVEAIRLTAREEIVPRFRALAGDAVAVKSGADDLVTVADRAAEAALAARARLILPGDAVLGEESVSDGAATLDALGSGRCVVIDPIDGTWNFAHGLATYGVLVAVVEDGETVWGCLYDPSFDDWILARRGGGAWLHRAGRARRLRVSQDDASPAAARGSVDLYHVPEAARPALAATLPRFRRASSLGASVHEYRLLCLGGSDFELSGGLHVWDHAAGTLALREAGGVARLVGGQDYAPTMRAGRLLNARTEALWHALAETFGPALAHDPLARRPR